MYICILSDGKKFLEIYDRRPLKSGRLFVVFSGFAEIRLTVRNDVLADDFLSHVTESDTAILSFCIALP